MVSDVFLKTNSVNFTQAPKASEGKAGQGDFAALLRAQDIDTSAAAPLERHVYSREMSTPEWEARRHMIEAKRALHMATEGLHAQKGEIVQKIRDVFVDMGMPIIDAVHLKRSPSGHINISGWGKGAYVSHPQGKFIEAVINGKIPQLAEQSEKLQGLLDDMDQNEANVLKITDNMEEKYGVTLDRHSGWLDHGFTFAVEHTSRIGQTARKLTTDFPNEFKAFKESLGSELNDLHSEQVYSRFYFAAVTLPQIPEIYLEYFDTPDKPILNRKVEDVSTEIYRLPPEAFN